jgi:4-amino-4-deoxy-L-arabinose transferase-like glycosyltransferase
LTGLWSNAGSKSPAHARDGAARGRLGPTLGSVVLVSLLICEVAAAMVGAEAVLFSTIVAAWLVLPAVVGLRNVLDAGCIFMLVSLGIAMVVGVAS